MNLVCSFMNSVRYFYSMCTPQRGALNTDEFTVCVELTTKREPSGSLKRNN